VGDVCLRATHKKARVEIAVALTTDLVREATRIHSLAATSAVALGRLLTGTALLAMTGKQPGSTSVQILSRSRIGSLYADCTDDGAARGMTKTPHLAFPLTDEERNTHRRTLAAAIHPGQISVIRRLASGEYGQSATPLVSGEVDEDLESYLVNSDQIPTLVVCDVALDARARIQRSGGAFVQAMPDGDPALLAELRAKLRRGGLAQKLPSLASAEELLAWVAPDAEQVESPAALRYECRCSRDRVLASLRMFPVTDLAEMASENESVEVGCDLCGKKYRVEPQDLLDAFKDLIKAQG
jgi:molecular chaperone Hsp33